MTKAETSFELAQLNIAVMKEPLTSRRMADFVANLARINAMADDSPGFVRRLQTEEGDATALRPFGEDMLVNMWVRKDVDALRTVVYKTQHVEILRRRHAWFERMPQALLVLWWVPRGHRPTPSRSPGKTAGVARVRRYAGGIQFSPGIRTTRCGTTA